MLPRCRFQPQRKCRALGMLGRFRNYQMVQQAVARLVTQLHLRMTGARMRGEDHLEGECGRYTGERQLVEGGGHVAEPWVISRVRIVGETMGFTWYDEFIASVMATGRSERVPGQSRPVVLRFV